jgi:glycosyltransferase involved in cell wall biosynthesis
MALHGLSRLRLRFDRWRGTILTLGRHPRVLGTACWRFPIYSQSFVYQELTQLLHQGYDLKFLYSELERRDRLPAQFEALWRGRRRMFLTPSGHEADVEHYRSRMPDRVEALVQLLCAASGLTRPELERHQHFRQSFSFARLVEAFQPRYLHSYFFYEGTLFTFVASYLLRIPRGVSCYSDHLLQDYDLKVVALHLRHCALVVATSQRIKRELLQMAPGLDADRVLVKPNAINASRFPIAERRDPAAGEPYRLVSVCRLDPKKGLAYLVRAVRILRDQGLNVEAHIVGGVDSDQPASADYARELEADVRALDLTRWVHLEGRRTEAEVSGFLQRSHLFVAPFVEMPSGDKDGIPTTLLEAMSTGQAAVGAHLSRRLGAGGRRTRPDRSGRAHRRVGRRTAAQVVVRVPGGPRRDGEAASTGPRGGVARVLPALPGRTDARLVARSSLDATPTARAGLAVGSDVSRRAARLVTAGTSGAVRHARSTSTVSAFPRGDGR